MIVHCELRMHVYSYADVIRVKSVQFELAGNTVRGAPSQQQWYHTLSIELFDHDVFFALQCCDFGLVQMLSEMRLTKLLLCPRFPPSVTAQTRYETARQQHSLVLRHARAGAWYQRVYPF